MSAHQGGVDVWPNRTIGTPGSVAAELRRYVSLGYRHMIAGFPAPIDVESMERLAGEVREAVES
jgi:hypothetical protein